MVPFYTRRHRKGRNFGCQRQSGSTADNPITFVVQAPARIIGVDNGEPSSHDSCQANIRPAFNGMAFVILQAGKAPGHVTVIAKAKGLKSATVEFDVQLGTAVATLP